MNLILLNNCNNYFNRKIFYYELTTDYTSRFTYKIIQDIDFNPNDGVSARQIINWTESWNPDYLLVTEQTSSGATIVSRWFIMDSKRTRGQQYHLTLRRDVIADHFNQVLSAPCFIEKGLLPQNSKLIYNSENVSLNQIKTDEILLKDETQKAWIVGYIGQDTSHEGYITSVNTSEHTYPEISSLPIELIDPEDPSQGGTFKGIKNNKLDMIGCIHTGATYQGDPANVYITLATDINNPSDSSYSTIYRLNTWFATTSTMTYSVRNSAANAWKNGVITRSALKTQCLEWLETKGYKPASPEAIENIIALNGQVVIDIEHAKYYQIDINLSPSETAVELFTTNGTFYNSLDAIATEVCTAIGTSKSIRGNPYGCRYTQLTYRVSFTEVAAGDQLRTSISQSRNHLIDAPYDMFCMQYNLDNLALAQQFRQALSTFVYDIQILPYFPFRDALDATLTEHIDYDAIEEYDEDTET